MPLSGTAINSADLLSYLGHTVDYLFTAVEDGIPIINWARP